MKAHTERWGGIWLEDTTIRCGNLAVLGSLAWYDYTADPNYQRGRDNYYWNLKKKVSNDAECIDWKYNDIQVSNMLRASLENRMTRLSQIAGVEQVMVITHVPVYARQMPYGSHVDQAMAFYGSYKTGDMLGKFPKLRYIVSGHTHRGAEDTVAGINMRVVDSHYGAPAIERIDIKTGSPYIRTLAI